MKDIIKNNFIFHFRMTERSFFQESAILGFDEFKELKQDREYQIKKIAHYNFKQVMAPFPKCSEEIESLKKVRATTKEELILLTTPSFISSKDYQNRPKEFIDSNRICFLINSQKELDYLKNYSKSNTNADIILICSKTFQPTTTELLSLQNKIYFYFPQKLEPFDNFLSTRQINSYIKRERVQNNFEIKNYPGLCLYIKNSPRDIEYFPIIKPIIRQNIKNVTDTIIIPTYNQKTEIIKTLKGITEQTNHHHFEVIIVDDGSTDGSLQHITTYIEKSFPKEIPITLLRHSRVYPRQMGDNRFRASIARNIGLSFAGGENIHFLDADILIPPNYIKEMSDDLKCKDIIQAQRYDLRSMKKAPIEWEKGVLNDQDIQENEYWYSFFQSTSKYKEFNQIENSWKYICTYALSLSKNALSQIGLIRYNYNNYGFEDTDYGLSAYKRNIPYFLSDIIVFHQPHPSTRSEFKNFTFERKKVLSKTAPIFYLNNLDPKIYETLAELIIPKYTICEILTSILKKLSYNFIQRNTRKG